MNDQTVGRGGDFYDERVTEEYLAHRHSGPASPNTVMEEPAFRDALEDVRDRRVLDLGCGDGSTAPMILGAGASTYHGIDGSTQMIARARHAANDERATLGRFGREHREHIERGEDPALVRPVRVHIDDQRRTADAAAGVVDGADDGRDRSRVIPMPVVGDRSASSRPVPELDIGP